MIVKQAKRIKSRDINVPGVSVCLQNALRGV